MDYLQEMNAKKTEFVKEIKDFSMTIGSKRANYDSLVEKKSLIERELDYLKQTISKNTEKLGLVKNNLNEFDNKNLELAQKKEALVNEQNNLMSHEGLINLDELKNEKINLEKIINNKKEEETNIKTNIASLNAKCDNFANRIESNSIRLEKYYNEQAKISAEIEKVEESFNVLNENILNFNNKKEKLEIKKNDLLKTHNEKNIALTTFTKQIEEKTIKISQKNAELVFLESASFDSGLSEDVFKLADSIVSDIVTVPDDLQMAVKKYIAKWSKVLLVDNNEKFESLLDKAKTSKSIYGILNSSDFA